MSTVESYPLDINRALKEPDCNTFINELFTILKPAGQKEKNQTAISVVTANLLHCHQYAEEFWVGISRDNNDYPPSSRYNPFSLSSRKAKEITDALVNLDLIELKKGFKDRVTGIGYRTRIQAKDKLIDLAKKHSAYPSNTYIHPKKEIIIRKDKNKKFEEYKDTPSTKSMRNDLIAWNDFMSTHTVDLWLSDAEIRIYPELNTINFKRTNLHRIFNNSSFKQGGRFYGHWLQEVESKYRKLAVIDAKRTIEVDWSSLHPAMLYALGGMNIPDEDLYELPGISTPRKDLKLIFQFILNCKSRREAESTAISKIRDGKLVSCDYKSILDAFERKHADIKTHFYSNAGVKLQYADSEMIRHIMKRFITENIPMVPIHDSIITWKSCEHIAQDAMKQAVIDWLQKGKTPIGVIEQISDDHLGEIEIFRGPEISTDSEYDESIHSDGIVNFDISSPEYDKFIQIRNNVRNRISKRIGRH